MLLLGALCLPIEGRASLSNTRGYDALVRKHRKSSWMEIQDQTERSHQALYSGRQHEPC